MISLRTLGLCAVMFGALSAYGQVGKITAQRNAQMQIGNSQFVEAKLNSNLNNGDTVRTGKRGFAELTFKEGSQIRVNERAEMVVQDVSELRRVRLSSGALWVKDRGMHTRVQTPIGTATARGTEFLIAFEKDVKVDVFEGTVDLENGGELVTINAGESGGFTPEGKPFKLGAFSATTFPVDKNGQVLGWWMLPYSYQEKSSGIKGSDIASGISSITLPFTMLLGNTAAKVTAQGIVTPPPTVPEPVGIVAIGMGVAFIAARRRK